jgi:hypothetical protein
MRLCLQDGWGFHRLFNNSPLAAETFERIVGVVARALRVERADSLLRVQVTAV